MSKTLEDVRAQFEADDVIEITAEKRSEGGNITPIDPEIREKALDLYMQHKTYGEICQKLNVNKSTLISWVSRGGWSAKRKETDALLFSEVMETKKYLLNDIVTMMLNGAKKALEQQAKDGFKPKDLPSIFNSLASIEKLSRLTHGLATSISEERSKRAQFTIPLQHLQDANVVKIEDPFNVKELSASDTGSGSKDS